MSSTKTDKRQSSQHHSQARPGSKHHSHHPHQSQSHPHSHPRPESLRETKRDSQRDSQLVEEAHHDEHAHPDNHPSSQHKSSTRASKKSTSKSTVRKSSRRPKGRAMPLRQKTYGSRAASWLEPRILLIATCVTLFGVFLYIIAISTNSWLILENPVDLSQNVSDTVLLEAYTGLWKLCKINLHREFNDQGELVNTERETCEPHNLFPSDEELQDNQDYDNSYLDYTRTAIAFTIIALCIMALGHGFAFYALRRPRYIIKRLAALLHFMTAACLLVLNEVFVKTVEHERDNMPGRIPEQAETHYGYSFVLSWLVFVCFLLAGLAFLFMSHKKKAEFAGDVVALEDEPMEIRR